GFWFVYSEKPETWSDPRETAGRWNRPGSPATTAPSPASTSVIRSRPGRLMRQSKRTPNPSLATAGILAGWSPCPTEEPAHGTPQRPQSRSRVAATSLPTALQRFDDPRVPGGPSTGLAPRQPFTTSSGDH